MSFGMSFGMSQTSSITSFAVRFRPMGPWRFGPDSGARDRVDLIYHSDAFYSAVCAAMSQLGLAEEWLQATATSADAPAVRFSSFFPFIGDTLLVVPPRSLWPPPESTKTRYKGAHFVPLSVIESLLSEKAIDEDRWAVDGESECLVVSNQGRGPFRVALRSSAGVDRLQNAAVEVHSTACLEFTRAGGLWTIVQFSDEAALSQWQAPAAGRFGFRRRAFARMGPIGSAGMAAVVAAQGIVCSGWHERSTRRSRALAVIALHAC